MKVLSEMQKMINFKCDMDDVKYVERMAKLHKAGSESEIWRLLVKTEIKQMEGNKDYEEVVELMLQVLALLRRIAGGIDEQLISLSREDAKKMKESLGLWEKGVDCRLLCIF